MKPVFRGSLHLSAASLPGATLSGARSTGNSCSDQHFTTGMLLYILHGTALEDLPKTTTDTNFGYAHVKGITSKVL